MGVTVTLKYLKELAPGRYEYRRRVPESVKAALGKGEFKRVFEARKPVEVSRNHALVEAEFAALVRAAGQGPSFTNTLTPREAALRAKSQAEQLLVGIVGAEDEDDARQLLGEDLIRRGADPVVYRAVVQPKAPIPGPTLEDARKLYLKEKLGGGEDPRHREARLRLEMVIVRAGEAGLPATCSLADIDRDMAKAVRDHMLSTEKKGGGQIKPKSVERDLAMLRAVISYCIKDFGLSGKVENQFSDLTIAGAGGVDVVQAEWEKKDPLPDHVISSVQNILTGDLQVLWRLLNGTGCRLAEIVGLRIEDLQLDGEIPFFRLRWHEVRRLKNASSIRPVPLVGDALDAAKEAMKLAAESPFLFPRYARLRGPDAASAVLMKYIRKVSQDPKHTVHSLRHTMKGRLRRARVDKPTQDMVLGHMTPSEGERYGGEADRVVVAYDALQKAFGLAEGK